MRIRVSVPEVWDNVELAAEPDWTVRRLKEEALAAATGRAGEAAAFEVKFRGAKILDESVSLKQLRVPDSAAFAVLRVRRQPVR